MNIVLKTYAKITLLAVALVCIPSPALCTQSNAFWAGRQAAYSAMQDFTKCFVKKVEVYSACQGCYWFELMNTYGELDLYGNITNKEFLDGMLQEVLQTDIRALLRDATNFDRAQMLAIYYCTIEGILLAQAEREFERTKWQDIVRKSIEKASIEVYGHNNPMLCDNIKKEICSTNQQIYISFLSGK